MDQNYLPFMPTPDHVHILVSRSPEHSEEELANIMAKSSAKFIIENKLSPGLFSWQEKCSAFSVSKSGVDGVCKYILNQGEHHKKETFAQEYDHYLKIYKD
jgi:REP element-mobilizing transposase RayT